MSFCRFFAQRPKAFNLETNHHLFIYTVKTMPSQHKGRPQAAGAPDPLESDCFVVLFHGKCFSWRG